MIAIDLSDRWALVCGVANRRSLAWAIARRLHQAGAKLILSYRDDRLRPTVARLAAELTPEPLLLPCDVRSEGEIAELFNAIAAHSGRLDYLVHSIAYAPLEELQRPFVETSRAGFHETLEISAYSLIALARGAAPLMRDGGAIVTLSFQAAERAFPSYNVMGVAKAALEGIVRQLAYELGEKNIRVNAISPGPVRTTAARLIPGFSQFQKLFKERAPLRREITHEDVANAALFLLSDLSSGITGEVLHVDSGYHIVGV